MHELIDLADSLSVCNRSKVPSEGIVRWSVSVAIVLSIACWMTDSQPGVAQDPSVDTIVQSVQQRIQSIDSFQVSFRMRGELIGTSEDAKKYLGVAYLTESSGTYAWKQPNKRYLSNSQDRQVNAIAPNTTLNEPGSESDEVHPLPIDSEGKLALVPETIQAFDGKLLRRKAPGLEMTIAEASTLERDSGWFNQHYLYCNMLMMPDAINGDRRVENNIILALAELPYRVLPQPETVNSIECTVLELSGKSKLWVARSLGWAVVQRESYDKTGLPVERAENLNFVEKAGIWFPLECRMVRFGPERAPPNLAGKPLMQYRLDVDELKLNETPDEFFVIQIPSGEHTIVRKMGDDGEIRVEMIDMPASEALLDQVVQQETDRRMNYGKLRSYPMAGLVILIAIVSIAIGFLAKRRAEGQG